MTFWLTIKSLVDTDIRKPDTGTVAIDRPTGSNLTSPQTGGTSESTTPIEDIAGQPYTEPLSEGEEDDEEGAAIATDENQRVGFKEGEASEAIAARNKWLKDDERTNGKARQDDGPSRPRQDYTGAKPRALSINPLAPAAAFDKALRSKLKGEARGGKQKAQDAEDQDPDEMDRAILEDEEWILTRAWRAEAGKKVAVPVRVEPKVFFACERTFLVCIFFSVDIVRGRTDFRFRCGYSSRSFSAE